MRGCFMRSMLVWLLVCIGVNFGVTSAPRATADTGDCRPAALFISADDSPLFDLQASTTITLSGASVTGTTPLDGVYWSGESADVERARRFQLCVVDEPTLHAVAEALRRQFDQQAVLTFDYLPEDTANAITIAVPDVDFGRFVAAFVADPDAHRRLQGGSVTIADHTLILIAGKGDLDTARRLVYASGGDWVRANVTYGDRELVS
ncbi:hypothetical protein A5661_07370 [Mycobacterium asiaticum]|nr:hypothetical protein A5661_07370 [Mycobacterium asiaticum]